MNINSNQYGFINFKGGQTRIFSDFDGTFMPKEFGHDIICNNNPPVDKQAFTTYFDEFQKLVNPDAEGKKDTELTVSTGRNLSEFNYYMRKIKENGLNVPVPDKLIITNGGDEFISHNPSYFTSDTKDMFNESDANMKKRRKMKKFVMNWDPYKITNRVKTFVSRLSGCPLLLEPMTHQGMYGYKGDMTLQEDIESLPEEYRLNYVSMRQDGGHSIRLTAPYGSHYIEELKGLSGELEQEGFKIDFQVKENNDETFVNSEEDPNKWQMGTSIEIKPRTYGKIPVLDKYHHVKLMTDEIRESGSDDLVIACGDGRNDLEMVDLSNYIDKMHSSADFSKEEFRDEISKLPLISIFVKNSSSQDLILEQYEKDFNFDGIKRFIIVDKDDEQKPHTLIEAIKLAKEEYSKINPAYGSKEQQQ